jgi:predicted ATPase
MPKKISPFINEIYHESGIKIVEVPIISIEERVKFILENS